MGFLYQGLFAFFKFMAKHVPISVVSLLGDLLAFLAVKIDKKHRKIIFANLKMAYGDTMNDEQKLSIAKRVYKNFFMYIISFLQIGQMNKEQMASKVKFENDGKVRELMAKGEKVLLITGHYGNWEVINQAIPLFFGPMSVVYRKIESPALSAAFDKIRTRFDFELIEKDGALRGLMAAVKKGRLVGVMVDQNTATSEGLLIDFFGHKARHTPVVSILSRRFDAYIVPIFTTTTDYRTYTVSFGEPISPIKTHDVDADVLALTQAQADAVEEAVRKKPDEWFWFHKRWKNQYEEIYK